ncbi:hypothetical protein [Nocardia gamkensis]|uniref:hypothetical protein n=1 Tax=Nocardia gamkensis TaxID=352869 RepID=UPI0037CA80B6
MSGRTVPSDGRVSARLPSDSPTDLAPLGPVAEVSGLAMVVAALAALTRIPAWTADYGVLVVAAAILYLAIAAGLVHWGVEQQGECSRDT